MARKRDDDSDPCGAAYVPTSEDEREVTITVSAGRGGETALIGDATPAHDLTDALGRDSIRIRVRKGEVVITIRTDASDGGGAPALIRIEPEVAESTTRRKRGRSLTRLAQPSVGFVTVPADKLGHGYGNFTLRADLAESYSGAYARVRALGGILTSSGAVRSLREPATPGRSKTSLHYTGRAIDLFIHTGMQGGTDRYMVTRNGGTDANPEWKLYCVSSAPLVNDPLYQQELVQKGELDCAIWKKGIGYTTLKRRESYFCLTDLLAEHGWFPIPARRDWKVNYLSCEWWHFQHHKGLVAGRSRFGDELLHVWSGDLVEASGLMLDAVWAGRSFRAPAEIVLVRAPRVASAQRYARSANKRHAENAKRRAPTRKKRRPKQNGKVRSFSTDARRLDES